MSELATVQKSAPAERNQQEFFLRPRYWVNESSDAYTIHVALPGVRKEGLEINLNDDALTITGRRDRATPEGWKPLTRELRNDPYRLSVQLNVHVKEDNISAKLEDGILNLELPKAEEAKPRTITVE